MAEININISEINKAVTKLQSLQSEYLSGKTVVPYTVGGGKTVNELEEIAEVYDLLNSDLSELISNTILFLKNVGDSYVSSDEKAAKSIANK